MTNEYLPCDSVYPIFLKSHIFRLNFDKNFVVYYYSYQQTVTMLMISLLLHSVNVAQMFDGDVCASYVVLTQCHFRDSMFES